MDVVSFRLLISFLCCLFIIIISQASAENLYCDNEKGNYTTNGIYQNNLKILLSSFSSHTEIYYGFYNISYGQDPDKVYAIGLCRGDRNTDDCLRYLNEASNLMQSCPNQKEAIRWAQFCMLRYSNRSIFGVMEDQPSKAFMRPDAQNVSGSVEQFNERVKSLMRDLTNTAASGDSRRKYATGSISAPNSKTIYGFTQCTPDLSSQDCTKCLKEAISELPQCCRGKDGGVVTKPSCRIKFGIKEVSGPTLKLDPETPPTSTNKISSQGKSNTSRTIIAIAVPVASVVLVLTLVCFYLRAMKSKKKFEITGEEDSYEDEITLADSLQFNFDTIRIATNEFADSNKLGQGGFGAVYRGQLSNGQEIAVKRLSRNSGQGDMEFKNEVHLVGKLQHRNLVRLLGFCLEGRERLLIYEFVPNKSLDYFIFDPIKKAQLDWKKRYKIIGGIARGLLYLHEDSRLCIIHRDLKASNILLDDDMHPKISDFGTARLVHVDHTQENTRKIVGTYGYMAPEYAISGRFSTKSDVFSFGVLILEIVSGQKNNSGICHGENVENLLSFVWRNWRDGTISNVVDTTINDGLHNEIMRCIHIGLLCVQQNVATRPTMTSIVLMLNSFSITLATPSEPAYVVDSRTRSLLEHDSSGLTNKSTQSINEVSITELYSR